MYIKIGLIIFVANVTLMIFLSKFSTIFGAFGFIGFLIMIAEMVVFILKLSNKTNKVFTEATINTKEKITSGEELITFSIKTPFSDKLNAPKYLPDTTEDNILPLAKEQFKTNSNKCWITKGESVIIAGIKINCGMLYVGSKLPSQKDCIRQDNCLINPRLEVSRNNDYYDGNITYWPSYSNISPQNRRRYLEWLANGAKNPNVCTGYVFLYFYGLERRLFLDQSIEDSVDIIDEIERLLSIYNDNRSINQYFTRALSYANLLMQKEQLTPAIKISNGSNHEIPFNIRLYLGKKLKKGVVFSSDDLLIWFLNHPNTILKTSAIRLDKEFISLMKVRLSKLNFNSKSIKIPKRMISAKYTASSNTFAVDLSSLIGNVPDISSINEPIADIQKLADEAMDDLDKLSRLLLKNPDARGTFKALTLLPLELIKEFGGDVVNEMQLWILKKNESQKGIAVLEFVKKITDHSSVKVTKSIYKEVEQVATSLGWNVIPARNEIIGSIKPDMQILLLPQNDSSCVMESPSQDFLLALFELTLGAYIIHADHLVLPEKMEYLSKLAKDSNYLNKNERNRLHLYVKWLAIQKVDLAMLKNKLKNINKDSKMAFADIAVAVAAIDGKITPQKIKALKEIYQCMGIDKKELFSSLHSITKCKLAHNTSPLNGNTISLDMERIEVILHDTAKSSALLASIFKDEISNVEQTDDTSVKEITSYAGLDNIYVQLLQKLLKKPEWSHDEYQKLASSLKLMPDGAIEAINEWAFEVYDNAIIENGDSVIVIYRELLNEDINNE